MFGVVLLLHYNRGSFILSASRTLTLHSFFFRARSRLFPTLVIVLTVLSACAPAASQSAPTRAPTRTPRSLAVPKVARAAPTDTPHPTRTPRPTRTRIPTVEHTPTRVNTPVKKKTRAPTQAADAAGANAAAPETTEPTAVPTQNSARTETPTNVREENSPLSTNAACDTVGGGDYGVLGAGGWEGRSPESHPDLNLAVRGYKAVNAFRGLVDYDGHTDGDAPQLWGLFADRRTPEIAHTYQVYDWDWGSNSRGDLIQDYEVTMAGFRVSEGETIFTPDFGHEIGDGYVALVLYADAHRVTLKYTGEDNVIEGYTLHIEGLCVYAGLLGLYNARQAAGRGALPALRPGQPIGYAPGNEIGAAIRDRGAFLDPRSRKDWWQGR